MVVVGFGTSCLIDWFDGCPILGESVDTADLGPSDGGGECPITCLESRTDAQVLK